MTLQSAIFTNFCQNFGECRHYDLLSFELRQKRPYLIHFLKLPWRVWSIRVYQSLYFLHLLSPLLLLTSQGIYSYKYVLQSFRLYQQSQYQMSKIPTQQRFQPPEVSQCLPTFRQVGNYMNSISSASTIFFERDNTHTRLQSQFKLNSAKPSLEIQIPLTLPAKESDILTYSQTSSYIHFEDTLLHLKKLLNLLSSRENMNNHVRQSLALSGFNMQSSKNIAKIITESFSEYISLAAKIDNKLIREEIVTNNVRIAQQNKELISLKEQNLQLFEKTIKLQNENGKYRKKIANLKQKMKSPCVNLMIISSLKQQFTKIMNKITIFQSQIFQKFVHFQNSLITVTNIRNKLLKNRKSSIDCALQSRIFQKENRKLQISLQMKSNIQRSVMRQLSQNNEASKNEIQNFKKTLKEKNDEIVTLNTLVRNLSEQLNEQKNLYEQMLDKNIELEKEIYLISSKPKDQSSEQSFCIIDEDPIMNYMSEGPHDLIDNPIDAVK